jgi:serine/threonine protein kinase
VGYIAPEMGSSAGYDSSVDLYALGVIIYDIMRSRYGKFNLNTVHQLFQFQWELDLIDLMVKLKTRYDTRIQDVAGVMGHPFFEGVEWRKVPSRPGRLAIGPRKILYDVDKDVQVFQDGSGFNFVADWNRIREPTAFT